MELVPQTLRAQIPRLGETTGEKDPMVWVRLTCEPAGWTWYVFEAEWLPPDAIFHGYAIGWDETVEYFNLSDLEQIAAFEGATIERDQGFVPCRLSGVMARERGPSKFPLGRVVATPGAVAALEIVKAHSLTYLRRHAHGEWGDLDEEDIEENEFSLTHGLRLLSAYSLADGTRLWIITEADRSVTTLLLPAEY